MVRYALPDHLAAWCEEQIAVGRAASIATYVAGLVAKDRQQQHNLARLRRAIADARQSGISMQDAAEFLTGPAMHQPDPRIETARNAVRQGRLSGTSLASIDGIFRRATLSDDHVPKAHAA